MNYIDELLKPCKPIKYVDVEARINLLKRINCGLTESIKSLKSLRKEFGRPETYFGAVTIIEERNGSNSF